MCTRASCSVGGCARRSNTTSAFFTHTRRKLNVPWYPHTAERTRTRSHMAADSKRKDATPLDDWLDCLALEREAERALEVDRAFVRARRVGGREAGAPCHRAANAHSPWSQREGSKSASFASCTHSRSGGHAVLGEPPAAHDAMDTPFGTRFGGAPLPLMPVPAPRLSAGPGGMRNHRFRPIRTRLNAAVCM